jgi:hypothetical protein
MYKFVGATLEERNETWALPQRRGGVGGALLGPRVDAVEEGNEGAGRAEVFSGLGCHGGEGGGTPRGGRRDATRILYSESLSPSIFSPLTNSDESHSVV